LDHDPKVFVSGSRTTAARRCPKGDVLKPTDEQAISARTLHAEALLVSAHLSRSGLGGARIPGTTRSVVGGFSGRRRPTFGRCPHLSYQSNKKARCRCDTGLSVFVRSLRPSVTSAMDGGGAYSPIDRRMPPSILALCNLAVLKAWLFLSHGQPDKGRLPLLYRIDAAKARTVHEKIPRGASVHTKTPKPLKLFPAPRMIFPPGRFGPRPS